MSFPKRFKFYLIDPTSGDFYYVDSGGDVQLTSTETALPNSPENWDKTEIKWARSTLYWGLSRSFTTPYIFHKDGHTILKHIYTTQGVEGLCKLRIKKADYANETSSVQYLDFYEGDLDFSGIDINKLGTTIQIVESGVREMITANADTDYEIPFDADAISIYMDGTYLVNTYKWITGDFEGVTNVTGAIPVALYQMPPENNLFETGEMYDAYPSAINQDVESNKLFIATAPMQVTFSANFYMNYFVDGGLTFPGELRILLGVVAAADISDALNALTLQNVGNEIMWADPNPISPGGSGTRNITFSMNWTLNPGERIILLAGVVNTNNPSLTYDTANTDTLAGGYFQIETQFRPTPTEVPAFRHGVFFDKLMQKMTGGTNGVSNFLATNTLQIFNSPNDTCLTSGRALRGYSGSYIKTNFNDYFKDAQSQWCVGMGLNSFGMPQIEPLEYWLDKSNELIDLGEVRDLRVEPFTEGLFNKISAGYPDAQNEYLNGQEEFNTTSKWSLPLIRVGSTLDLTSRYRYGMYDIEGKRIYLLNKGTTDDKGDNEVYGIEISNVDFHGSSWDVARIQNETGYSASGILFPATAFNLATSPLSKLFRNAPRILPALHLMGVLTPATFETTDRNHTLQRVNPSSPTLLDEDSDIPKAALMIVADALYHPIMFRFTTKVPENIMSILEADDKGYFAFTYNGVELKGFPMNVGCKPYHNEAYEFELLCHPNVAMADIVAALTI